MVCLFLVGSWSVEGVRVCVCLWRDCEGSQPFVRGVSSPYVGESLCLVGSGRGLACSWCDGRAKWVDG